MEPFGRQPPRFVPTLTDVVPQGLPLYKAAQPQEPVMDDFLRPDVPSAVDQESEAADGAPSPHGEGGARDQRDAELPESGLAAETAAVAIEEVAAEPVWLSAEPVQRAATEPDAVAWEAVVSLAPVAADADPVMPDLILPDMVAPSVASFDLDALQEAMVARILARVQPQLEAHLREVVADVVSQHTDAMARSLHLAVEEVVQQAVTDAMAQEKIQANLDLDAYQ